jgi:hypothetical protein
MFTPKVRGRLPGTMAEFNCYNWLPLVGRGAVADEVLAPRWSALRLQHLSAPASDALEEAAADFLAHPDRSISAIFPVAWARGAGDGRGAGGDDGGVWHMSILYQERLPDAPTGRGDAGPAASAGPAET